MERYALVLVVVLAAAVLACVKWFAPTIAGVQSLPSPPMPSLLVLACAVAAITLILAALFSKASRRYIPQLYVPLMILISSATVAGLVVADHWLRLGLLEMGALLTVALVWQSARTLTAKLTYLAVILISALSLVSSDLLMIGQGHFY
jgi:hypothetical protein